MTNRIIAFLFFLLAIGFYSCQQNREAPLTNVYIDLPSTPYQYNSTAPNDYVPTLGRVLFYDARLSANNSVSCSSCHKQSLAFSDNSQFSRGFMGQLTTRNSMPIQNLRVPILPGNGGGVFLDSGFVSFSNSPLFWDGREVLIEAQVLRPITNHIEMGMTIDDLVTKLSQLTEYRSLFANAFGDESVTETKISTALSSFISSITSNQSKLDLSFHGQVELSAAEKIGYDLFLNKYNCNSCHRVLQSVSGENGIVIDPIPGDSNNIEYIPPQDFLDIGLDTSPSDIGRADFTHVPSDVGRFKIPTLRNVALTAPYMHDGRFATLGDVVEHYSNGIANSPNLDILLTKNGSPKQMNISESEKQSIIAFLNTLTDYQMITDPKFSSPFKSK